MKYRLYIGRWCPFHDGHRLIVDAMVKNGQPVCIAVRETNEKYPVSLRVQMIAACYPGEIQSGMVRIITIPDIESVCVGRGVGYALVEAPEEIQKISGTGIRQGTCNAVPKEVQEIIDEWESQNS